VSQPKTTEWFDGQKFNPGQSGVYKVRINFSETHLYSHFDAEAQSWNGDWPTVNIAHANRSWTKQAPYERRVCYMIGRGWFEFCGLKDKP
jgi:hypothetical protein